MSITDYTSNTSGPYRGFQQILTRVTGSIYREAKAYEAFPVLFRATHFNIDVPRSNKLTLRPQEVDYISDIRLTDQLRFRNERISVPQIGIEYEIQQESIDQINNSPFPNIIDLNMSEAIKIHQEKIDYGVFYRYDKKDFHELGKEIMGVSQEASAVAVTGTTDASNTYSDGGHNAYNDVKAILSKLAEYKLDMRGKRLTLVTNPLTAEALNSMSDYDHPNIILINEMLRRKQIDFKWVESKWVLGDAAESTTNGCIYAIPEQANAGLIEYGGIRTLTDPTAFYNGLYKFKLISGVRFYAFRPELIFKLTSVYL